MRDASVSSGNEMLLKKLKPAEHNHASSPAHTFTQEGEGGVFVGNCGRFRQTALTAATLNLPEQV